MSANPHGPGVLAITGATGFVGRHLVKHALAAGWRIVSVSRSSPARAGFHDVRVRNYLDVPALVQAFSGCDAVIHLAARAHMADAADPAAQSTYDAANVATAEAIAEAVGASGVRRLVFVSSIGVYGNETRGRPFRSDDPAHPEDAYARSKLAAECAVATRLASGTPDYVIVRPPLVYGPDCPGNFARLLEVVGRLPAVPLGAVRSARSLVHVDNLADALLVAAVDSAVSRGTFIVADAETLMLSEIVELLASGMGRSRSTVWRVPPAWLRLIGSLSGRGRQVQKLLTELQVDATAFSRATGWHPPTRAQDALPRTAAEWKRARA